MKKKKTTFVLGEIIRKLAPEIGATVHLEPEWGVVGQIQFKNGKKSYFRYSTLDLNPMGASAIAKDKGYANFFMEKLGYPTIPRSKAFYSKKWSEAINVKKRSLDDAFKYAQKIGLPVIIKPNSGSQGTNVALVHNKNEFYRMARSIFKHDNVMLVQEKVSGTDCRIVVLDNKVISAYTRTPLSICGDGKSTILELLNKKLKDFKIKKREVKININDIRIKTKLSKNNLDLKSVIDRNVCIYLLDNANLSTGGDSNDVTSTIHEDFKRIAVSLTRDMGLRFCGVDLMIDGDITNSPNKYWVIEINSAPGLDHYVKIGKEQKQIVENLYLQVLKHLEDK